MYKAVLPEIHEYSDLHVSNWFAIRVKSNFERPASISLQNRGYEVFLPLYHSRKRCGGRIRDNQRPLFPGYVFSRFDVNNRLPILMVPGVVHIVGTGKLPVPIESGEIEAIRRAVHSLLPLEPWPFLKSGQRVLIEAGPLAGLEGIVLQVRKNYRLIVSVTLLQRSVSVEIEPDWCAEAPAAGLAAALPAFVPAR